MTDQLKRLADVLERGDAQNVGFSGYREDVSAAEAAVNTIDALVKVAEAAKDVVRFDKGDGGSRLILEADLRRLEAILTDLDACIEAALGDGK